ncbi:exosome complex component RRP41-like [Daphnia pulex]|uniref:exosome complex component RRP41-like n=1 Tax=Daphnia pulex TaxID=6669 RepID=UPI001EE0DC93|nr:exosome complex component RRP41-like [Daphnia pulex]XP_046636363.1 exosome complex component RRP41-like [Daphnia pulicaria]
MSGNELLSDQGLRIDGRKPNELRRIRCSLGIFSQADGSAYLEQGNTKVLAAVYGPHEIRGSKSKALHDKAFVNCQYSTATFSMGERKRRPRGDRKSTEMSTHLEETFAAAIRTELYPRSQIDIFVEVLQADGGNYTACVNAAMMALVDAGVPLKDTVVSCTASLVKDVPLVDVNHVEQSGGSPELVVSILPHSGEIVYMSLTQRFHIDHLSKVLDTAIKGCKDIGAILNEIMKGHLTKLDTSLQAS